MDGKVVIVTGASQGIGAGIVQGYRERGFRIVANSRSISQGREPEIVAVPGDIADPDTAERLVRAALTHFGRIDTLVNNAGIFIPKPVTQYSTGEFTKVVGVNLGGFFHATCLAAEVMQDQGSGHIVSITSSLVDQPMTAVPAVLTSLTKGGIVAATRALSIELASKGIRVNAVSPGIIATPMHTQESHGMLASLHPLGRMGRIEEVVEAVLYLERATFVTGEILHVDGGQSAGHWTVTETARAPG
ncbi:SDR family NAD(P)-dependent oxidoreductase [Bosea caraganae]|uniref:SDR family NAD(P)-dependent oxidoreductase n=2 Tax=Bosea caraganae TaxID=2763117 RepID=A0A370L9N3_9HYPH|nr:SDR family NAD(P)-dependent oxidoreductase [Bosea caraganae]RDJ27929.1 SDR family NAD(P)-dependent oxidoreductase [Bosea caraganae]